MTIVIFLDVGYFMIKANCLDGNYWSESKSCKKLFLSDKTFSNLFFSSIDWRNFLNINKFSNISLFSLIISNFINTKKIHPLTPSIFRYKISSWSFHDILLSITSHTQISMKSLSIHPPMHPHNISNSHVIESKIIDVVTVVVLSVEYFACNYANSCADILGHILSYNFIKTLNAVNFIILSLSLTPNSQQWKH